MKQEDYMSMENIEKESLLKLVQCILNHSGVLTMRELCQHLDFTGEESQQDLCRLLVKYEYKWFSLEKFNYQNWKENIVKTTSSPKVKILTTLELCSAINCKQTDCEKLHLCKNFVFTICKENHQSQHDFRTSHNIRCLQIPRNGLHSMEVLDNSQLKTLLRQSKDDTMNEIKEKYLTIFKSEELLKIRPMDDKELRKNISRLSADVINFDEKTSR